MHRRSLLGSVALAAGVALLVSIGTFVGAQGIWHSFGTDRTPQDWVSLDLMYIEGALDLYRLERGALPESLKALEAGYLRKTPVDRWGNALVYRTRPEKTGYLLYSLGRNGIDEAGGGDDITTEWKKFTCEQYEEVCWSAGDVICITSLASGLLSALALLGIGIIFAYRSFKI